MTRGNQRELARKKNQKKLAEGSKKKKSGDEGNAGAGLKNRQERDADIMRQKQAKAVSEKEGATGGK